MAVIQTIRTKYAKLTTAIIVIALLGFILMDLGRSGGSRSTTIGEINGEKIDFTEYEAAIQAREAEIKQQNPNLSLDDQMQAQIRDQVWEQLVQARLMDEVANKLGLTVSKAELNDMLTGPNPDPMVRQAFTDPNTGQFNPQEVAGNIQRLRKDPNTKNQWAQFEEQLVKRRYEDKFESMVKGAIYVPKFVLQNQMDAKSEVASVQFVKLPFSLISDEEAKVTDEEIKAYMQKRPKMFHINQTMRSIDYVAFQVVPSHEDSARVLNTLNTIKSDFESAKDAEAFVNRNSETPNPPTYFTKDQLSQLPNAEELTAAPVSAVVGPFYDGANYVLAKMLEKSMFPDSVTARHILVRTSSQGQPMLSDSAAKNRIDSAIAFLRAGVPFDSVAVRFSDDEGSKNNGGKYEFVLAQKPQLSKEFGDFIFEASTGNTKVVSVSNDNYAGYHYIEILEQSPRTQSYKLAFVAKSLSADKNTYNDIYAQATQFAAKVNNKVDFDKAAQEAFVPTAVADGINQNSFLINGIGSSRDLVKWVYEAKVGDVSPIYTVGDQYIVARLNGIQEKGLVNINEETRPILADFVRREKKAKMLMDKYKNPSSLASLAQTAQQEVQALDSLRFSQSNPAGLENEPKAIGYAFYKDFKPNTISPAIPGNDGVFYLSVFGRNKVPTDANEPNERLMLESGLKANSYQMILNAMRESAKVKDQRAKIYN